MVRYAEYVWGELARGSIPLYQYPSGYAVHQKVERRIHSVLVPGAGIGIKYLVCDMACTYDAGYPNERPTLTAFDYACARITSIINYPLIKQSMRCWEKARPNNCVDLITPIPE
jgi:hypothetical protein